MPGTFLPNGHLVLAELAGDIIFVFIVMSLTDIRNPLVNPQTLPLLVGLAVFLVSGVFGWYVGLFFFTHILFENINFTNLPNN